MASKTKTGSFYDLIRPLVLVLVYSSNFQQGKFLKLHEMFVPISWFIAINFIKVLITKMALTKLLENTLDESSKLENIFDERLGYLTKSCLSQNFYQTVSDISKTLISHPAYSTRWVIKSITTSIGYI